MLTPSQILERLEASFGLLVGGARTSSARQQTLQATLDWSHALLATDEQVLFRRLAVFAGGWTLDSAEVVCAGGDVELSAVLDLVGRLVDKSLAVMEERDGRARYKFLEPVRQYAARQLERSGELAWIEERHANACLAFAKQFHFLERPDEDLARQSTGCPAVVGRPRRSGCGAGDLSTASVLVWTWRV
jgi:predicted ATPase